MAITSASDMDTLVWERALDQDGTVDPTPGFYNDITVQTVSDGTTYVAITGDDGDVELYSYDEATCALTQLATHIGRNYYHQQMNDPQIMEVDGKIAIVGGTDTSHMAAFTYDPANQSSNIFAIR